jgi:hypothetical protein
MRHSAGVVLGVLLLALLAASVVGQTAGNRITVGLLSLHSVEYEKAADIGVSAFRRGMQALGHEEGRDYVLTEGHAEGDASRLPTAGLLAQNVTVFVAVGTEATQAAAEVTTKY